MNNLLLILHASLQKCKYFILYLEVFPIFSSFLLFVYKTCPIINKYKAYEKEGTFIKKHFKALLPVLLLTGLLFGLSMTASAEDSKEGYWVQNGDRWWFQCTDDWYPSNGLYEIDGVEYAFDQWGYMVTGWWQDEYDNYYYFDLNSGAMQKGWVWDGAWYYMDPEYGFMYYDGYFWIDETSYLLRPDGSMVSGWYYYDYDPTDEWEGSWQYRNQNGTKYDGWLLDGGQWYYIADSYMVNNTAFSPGIYEETGDETAWIFDAAGHLVYGGWYWVTYEGEGGTWLLANADGTGYNGWLWENNHWYYIDNGYMINNTTYTAPDGYIYAFDGYGYLVNQEGWIWIGDSEYGFWTYTDGNGAVLTNSWKWIDGKCYYFGEYGNMYSNGTYMIDGVEYSFDHTGAWIQ